MRKRFIPLCLLLAALIVAGYRVSQAQQASGGVQPVQQTATHLDAATFVASNGTSNTTTTITPPSGQFVYVTGVDIQNCASGTNVTAAAQNSLTTTNIGGAAWQISVGPLAGTCAAFNPVNITSTLKSAAPGTAVTFVVPTFGTNQTLRLNVYYYFAY